MRILHNIILIAFFPFGRVANNDKIIERAVEGPINFMVQFHFYRRMEQKFYVSFTEQIDY